MKEAVELVVIPYLQRVQDAAGLWDDDEFLNAIDVFNDSGDHWNLFEMASNGSFTIDILHGPSVKWFQDGEVTRVIR